MVRLASGIVAPGIAAFISGGIQGAALRGIENREGGQTPKWALVVPGLGAAASMAGIYAGRGSSSHFLGTYCASFSTAGWLVSKMFVKQGA